MEFKRINQETVRCILDEEDLIENNIKLEDLFKNTQEMQEFLHMLVEKAAEEVGYEPKNSGMVSMQIMPMPQNRVSITITDNTDKSFAGILDNIKSAVKDLAEEYVGESVMESKIAAKTDNKESAKPDISVVTFENMDGVFSMVKACEVENGVSSSLYYDEELKLYYLVIKRGRASRDLYERTVLKAADYGVVNTDAKQMVESISEYYKCIIKTKAIETMRTLA